MTTVQILEIGRGIEGHTVIDVENMFSHLEDKKITLCDTNPEYEPDIVHDIRDPFPAEWWEHFDIVVLSHVLEHIEYFKVIPTLKNIRDVMRSGGEMWIFVPSLEWVCQEIEADRETVALQASLYGGQFNDNEYHKSGFTLNTLRQVVETIGFIVRKAHQSIFNIQFDGEGMEPQQYQAVQNVVVAMRYDIPAGDPATAID